jgi:DNA-binding CsgD family transcriptional regulator
MPRHGIVFTPRAVETIRRLADHEKTAAEIADVIGSTAGSVRVKCSQLKIKLTRGRRRNIILQIGRQKLTVYMRPSDCAALKWKAARLQRSSDELAADLLEAIISSDIYEAVLDEDDAHVSRTRDRNPKATTHGRCRPY